VRETIHGEPVEDLTLKGVQRPFRIYSLSLEDAAESV